MFFFIPVIWTVAAGILSMPSSMALASSSAVPAWQSLNKNFITSIVICSIYLHTMANDTWISYFFNKVKDNISFLFDQIKAFHFQMFIGNNIAGMVEQIDNVTSGSENKM